MPDDLEEDADETDCMRNDDFCSVQGRDGGGGTGWLKT